ncbi:mannosyltransferase family protein [Dactylosporangium sp. CA-233914]|uniref:mannosyltransferase family protein n=1 Tax=Dactylosporangium sp. CA-233914 TaxID=3239934 RepID=UPI003D8E080C
MTGKVEREAAVSPAVTGTTAETSETSSTTDNTPEDPAPTPKWRAWIRPWMAPWIRSLKAAAGVWLAAGLAYVVVTVFAGRFVPTREPQVHNLLGSWYQFDTLFYVRIAEDGYLYNKFAPAFYPLYPGLIKLFNPILPGGAFPAALFVSIMFALVALTMLHRLVDEEFGEKVASRTVFYIAAFPAGFFFLAAYNESLFLALVLMSLYAARKGNFWFASAFAALAGSTRLFGLLLAAPLAYEYMRQRGWSIRKIRWDALSFAFIPSGVIAFAIFLQIKLGDWLAFSHAQDGWKRTYGWPGQPIWKTLKLLNDKPYLLDWRLLQGLNLVCVVGAMVLLLLTLRKGRFHFRRDQYYLLVYAAAPIFLFICTEAGWPNYLMSAPRIALEWFPCFIVLGMMGASRTFERVYLFMALTSQTLFLAPMLLQIQFFA